MTKEEAIDIIKCLAWHTRPNEEDVEQAIKALEQETCVTMRDLSEEELKHFAEEMKKVRPQVIEQESKIRHWIEGEVWEDTDGGWGRWQKCSVCRQSEHHKTKFCPNCGAKMESEEE